MICDHDATRASLRVFLAATGNHQVQQFGGDTVLTGDCRGCSTPLSVEVDLARGRVVRGEIVTATPAPTASGNLAQCQRCLAFVEEKAPLTGEYFFCAACHAEADRAARATPGQDVIAGEIGAVPTHVDDGPSWVNDPTVQAIR